jgi:hypothetical protein
MDTKQPQRTVFEHKDKSSKRGADNTQSDSILQRYKTLAIIAVSSVAMLGVAYGTYSLYSK